MADHTAHFVEHQQIRIDRGENATKPIRSVANPFVGDVPDERAKLRVWRARERVLAGHASTGVER